MFKKTMTALGFTLIALTPALAVEGPFPVREVDTITSFEAMENPNALQFYPNVAEDVENAIRAGADMMDEDDIRPLDLDVRITSMRLNDDPVLVNDGEFNILEGFLVIRDGIPEETITTEAIMLRAEEMSVPYTSVSPDNRDFYNAMVAAFADRVVTLAGEVNELPELAEVQN